MLLQLRLLWQFLEVLRISAPGGRTFCQEGLAVAQKHSERFMLVLLVSQDFSDMGSKFDWIAAFIGRAGVSSVRGAKPFLASTSYSRVRRCLHEA